MPNRFFTGKTLDLLGMRCLGDEKTERKWATCTVQIHLKETIYSPILLQYLYGIRFFVFSSSCRRHLNSVQGKRRLWELLEKPLAGLTLSDPDPKPNISAVDSAHAFNSGDTIEIVEGFCQILFERTSC